MIAAALVLASTLAAVPAPAEDNVAIKRFRAALAAGNRPLMAKLTPGGFFDSDADAKMEAKAFFDAVVGCRITSSTATMIYLDCARKRPAPPASKCFTDAYVVQYWNDEVSPAVATLARMRRRTAECTLAPALPRSN